MVQKKSRPQRSPERKSAAERRALHLAEEYDEFYQQIEWMLKGCPSSPGDEFTQLGGVSRPRPKRTKRKDLTRQDLFPKVRLPRDYLGEVLARDIGSITVVVGPGKPPDEHGDTGESAIMTVTFSGPVDGPGARAAFKEGLAQVIDRLGSVGKPKDSARLSEAAYLFWLIRERRPRLGPEEAGQHWNALRAQWRALETGESADEALLVGLPARRVTSARGAKKAKAIETPLEGNPEAYYAHREWLAAYLRGEQDEMYDGKRVSQLIARARPSLSQYARSGEDDPHLGVDPELLKGGSD